MSQFYVHLFMNPPPKLFLFSSFIPLFSLSLLVNPMAIILVLEAYNVNIQLYNTYTLKTLNNSWKTIPLNRIKLFC